MDGSCRESRNYNMIYQSFECGLSDLAMGRCKTRREELWRSLIATKTTNDILSSKYIVLVFLIIRSIAYRIATCLRYPYNIPAKLCQHAVHSREVKVVCTRALRP